METTEPIAHTRVYQLGSWEEFQEKVASFEDQTRKPWDEIWFRGQANAQWPLHTTLERRSTKVHAVANYFNIIAEIKSAIETFTNTDFHMPTRTDVETACREYDRFEWVLRESATYLAHLRHGGFPSPLLDWTHSPYVAAYFAFSGAKHDGDVAVYAYRERPVNIKVGGSDGAQIISFGPLIKTHKRHFRQQSRYTACVKFEDGQWHFTPHDSVFGMKDHQQQDLLWKMAVPAKERQKVLRYFDKFNLNEFTLFDSEEGLLEMLAARAIDMRE
jgi:hypothetical protein